MRENKKGGRLEVARSHGKRGKTLLIYCHGRGGLKFGTRLLISPFEVTVLVDTSKEKKGSNRGIRGIHSSVFTAVLRPVLIFVLSRVLICVLKPLRKPCGLFTRQNVSELQGLAPKGG
jgi:hypothetical protein